MSIKLGHFKRRIDENSKKTFSFREPVAILMFLWIGFSSVGAQEYATDRIFMKQYSKAKCRLAVENKIKHLKKSRDMTLEHEEFLNRIIWSKSRINFHLSLEEKKRLDNLKLNGITKKKISSKSLLAKNARLFQALRLKCK